MKAHKIAVTVPEDHQLEIHLPEDFPAGPAEVIVLADASRGDERASRKELRAALEDLRTLQRTEEEERILDEFDRFREENPFSLASLHDEDR